MVDIVERFLSYLTIEKGLSSNTLEAYKRDIRKFSAYLNGLGKDVTNFSRSDVLSFINRLRDSGNQTATLARRISSVRGLCKFMLIEKIIEEDPVENLSAPKGWKKIPKIIGVDDVSILLGKPRGEKLSLRDQALLEIIYSCGLRASEVINMKVGDINFEAGFITVQGKGSKERVIPANEPALKTVKRYIEELKFENPIIENILNDLYSSKNYEINSLEFLFRCDSKV